MIFQAHKGVSSEYPENTMPAFEAAIRQGYRAIELDAAVTKDGKFVLLHDETLNRTGRLADGTPLPREMRIGDVTYDEALAYDFGLAVSKKFAGTKLPLLSDVLLSAKEHGVSVKIDNKYQSFTEEKKRAFFEFLKDHEDVACLTCSKIDELERAAALFPKMRFHFDGLLSDENLSRLARLLPKERLTLWLPLKTEKTLWVTVDFASRALADKVKRYGSLGVWILSRPEQVREAVALGADVIETDGEVKPEKNRGLTADMHTHSEFSHDSVCKIEDMLASQRAAGTTIFAVTDHFDTNSFDTYDVFTPIENSAAKAKRLNAQTPDMTVLSGVELGEGFWFPDKLRAVERLADYDVIIGSVHLVRYKELTTAYSGLNFASLGAKTAEEYFDAYLDDVSVLLDTTDIDILAHLTCPLRYIAGKYGLTIDMARYAEKIERILRTVIEKRIALEVNTSSLSSLSDFMPAREIIEKYHDMGGYLITLGSDAHVAQNASIGFDTAKKVLKEIGFANVFYYKNRDPYQITL